MAAPSLHDALVRWNPFRGYWVDNGFGVNPWHEFYPTEAAATRVALSSVTHPTGRVLVQRGAEWLVVSMPALLDPAHASGYATVRARLRTT
jgi:hypothetical protein